MLTAFWFSTNFGLGYGVTAENQEIAESMLNEFGYPTHGQVILSMAVINSASELEKNHVAPNAGPIVVRGIWFPNHVYYK